MVNIDELLDPISEENPCGEYLRYEPIYDEIQEYRREDDPQLSQGVWERDIKKANWPQLLITCEDLLKHKTKDLQITAWITEALTVLHGFKGLRHGTELLRRMSEKFWDQAYPQIDTEHHNFVKRMVPFNFFTEKIPEKIIMIHLTAPTDNVSGDYSLADYMTARYNLRMKVTSPSALSLQTVRKSVSLTPSDFYDEIQEDVDGVEAEIKLFENFLTEKFGKETPSFRQMHDHLKDIQQIISNSMKECLMLKPRKQSNISSESSEHPPINNQSAPPPPSEPKQNAIAGATIENAYKALRDISNFLEFAQPQSPSSALIKMAISIGGKSFRELLELNMQDGTSIMNTISELHIAINKMTAASAPAPASDNPFPKPPDAE